MTDTHHGRMQLLHEIYLLAMAMPPRTSFEEMFSTATEADLQAVKARLEAVEDLRPRRTDDAEGGIQRGSTNRIRDEIERFGVVDVANLADARLAEHVDRLQPGVLADRQGKIEIRVGAMQVTGPAGNQDVLATATVRVGDRVEFLEAIVRGTWNGKEIGFKSMSPA